MELSSLDQLARRQHGIVARRQTQLTEAAWRRAIDSGKLIGVHPGVARLVGTADTPEQRIMAAVTSIGPGALASHRSAAHLHGVPGMADSILDEVDIIVVDNTRRDRRTRSVNARNRQGVRVHRPRDLRRLTPQRIANIPCTSVLRTLVDLGAVAPAAVHGAVGHALTAGLASLDAIESARDHHARRGRRGIAALRQAIDDWAIDGKPADSVLEPAMKALVGRYGLPPVEFHPTVGGREVDFRIIGTPIILECDGWAHHGRQRHHFERDRAMDAEFAARGWIVTRFTYRQVTRRPRDVAATILRTVERWTDRPAPDAA